MTRSCVVAGVVITCVMRSGWAERFEPWHRTAVVLLDPYLPECLQGGEVAEAQRSVGGLHRRQELIAVRADLPGERLARVGLFRQAGLVGPEAIAAIPIWRHLLLHSRGRRRTELIERITESVVAMFAA
jgi:hypothetical protein